MPAETHTVFFVRKMMLYNMKSCTFTKENLSRTRHAQSTER